MTKDVIITMKGLQFDIQEQEPLEVTTAGYYFFKNGKHYVLYDELSIETGEEISNIIKIGKNRIDVIKKGESSAHMVFEPGKKNISYYATNFGDLLIGINTLDIQLRETDLNIDVDIGYALEMNYSHVSDCAISLNIKSKEDKDFTLQRR